MMCLDVYTYYDYKQNGDKNTLYYSLASDVACGWLKCAFWILDSAQRAIICDENLNSTHWAAMQTYFNVSNALPFLIGSALLGNYLYI